MKLQLFYFLKKGVLTMSKLKWTLLPLSIGVAILGLAGCNKNKNDANTLNVVYFNKGFGAEWINEAKDIWESENPGYKINLNATSDARAVITSDMAKRNNTDDVYISNGTEWKTYAAQEKLLRLDDLLEETVDGMKVKDKVNDEYKNSIYFKIKDGSTHSYRLPWTSGVGGIMYNAKMFEDNGWAVPTTTEELLTLCQYMIDHPTYVDPDDPTSPMVYPFAYTGENTDYFDYAVFSWWGQLAGEAAITSFKNYGKEDASKFDVAQNETFAKLKTATEAWYSIFGNSAYYDAEDITRDNHTAQKNFIAGKAAMMINGDWCYNEMLTYSSEGKLPDNFELKLMSTPTITGGTHKASYIIGEDQFIAIPATTIKADLAKSFIKTLISDRVLKIFFNKAHGMMAYKLSTGTYTTVDKYMSSLLSYRSALEETFTNFSPSLLFLNGYVDLWGAPAGRPYLGLLQGTLASVNAAFDAIRDDVARQWPTWVANARM